MVARGLARVGRVALLGAAIVAVGGGAALAAAAPGWPMRQDGGYLVVDTPHYQIRTDHSADIAQLVASHQEALFQELYRRLAGNKPVPLMPRLEVQVFSAQEKYMDAVGKEGKGTQGMFSQQQIKGWAPAGAIDNLLGTLRHEGTHQFVAQFIGPKCPLWLNEGLAEFFQQAQFKNGQLETGQVPAPEANLLKRNLEAGKLIPLDKILSITVQDWNSNVRAEALNAQLQYAEAWSIVHFLQGADGGRYRGPFIQYIYYISRSRSPAEAWEKAFGAGTRALQERWHAYLKDLKPTGGLTCRDKLGLIARWLAGVHQHEEVAKDMATFRQAAVDGKFGGWSGTWGDGSKLEINEKDALKDLFRCPDDAKTPADESSYEMGPPAKEGEPPVLRCRHHAGYVLETSYEKNDQGGWTISIVSRPALPGAKDTATPGRKSAGAAEKKPAAAPAPTPAAGARQP